MPGRTMSHYAFFRFSDAHWALAPEERAAWPARWLAGVRQATPRVDVYQVFPSRADADIVLWSALPVESDDVVATFFRRLACAVNPYRHLLQPVHTLWGFTRPSDYARGQSAQEIDPLAETRQPYLVIYPFVKTKEWYLMSRDARQGMMNEHIRIGHQYPEIKQLLLYSFGLQDQEFVVVYETADLFKFSALVTELRSSEVRRYTERDTPIYTAVYHPAEETLALWQ